MKRITFIAVTILIMATLMEAFSALLLFRYFSAINYFFYPRGLATAFLINKTLKKFHPIFSTDPSPLFLPDKALGYTTIPGRYRVGITLDTETLFFTYTVSKPGVRATAYTETQQPNSIYVFGDSSVLGWVNNDEHSMPWLLQQKFPHYNVINLAQPGYGIVQAMIQYQAMANKINSNDVIVLPYAQYYLERNYGTPNWMKLVSIGIQQNLGRREAFLDAGYPVVRVTRDGNLVIERLKYCEQNPTYCDGPEPEQSLEIEATKAIIDYFAEAKAKVVFTYIDGGDDDPVVKHAGDRGLTVIDIRLNQKSPEWDNFVPFDTHPGPRAQYNYFDKLANGLVAKRVISLPVQ
jgi:hypothetical protein